MIDMTIILSGNRCTSCGEKLIKNPDCGGDYYNTILGYRLQEYCNNNCERNGILEPPLDGKNPNFISNRKKKYFATQIAKKKHLGIIETKKIAKTCNTNNKDNFLKIFSKKIKLPYMEVSTFFESN